MDEDHAVPETRRLTDDALLVAAALRRSTGSLNTGSPTRTLRITASEKTSRDNTPIHISLEDLSRRPRSNPRSRTPMRFESPLSNNAFRAVSPSPVPEEPRRSTIRPLVDSAAGRITYERSLGHPTHATGTHKTRSSKQGQPSHRKIRRWNNEHFSGLAAEISASSARGVITAEILLKAQREAHLYRPVYDPKEHSRSKEVSRFMQGTNLKKEREQFFEGEGPMLLPSPGLASTRMCANQKCPQTATHMLNRMDPRLRKLVGRAYRNSYAASKVIEYFEEFVTTSFVQGSTTNTLDENWWNGILLEAASITRRNDNGRCSAQVYFPATSSTGGFHRLLLQAVCQFHGLVAVPKMERNFAVGDTVQAARALWVKGVVTFPAPFRLAAAIGDENEEVSNIKDDESIVIVSNEVSTLNLSDDESSDAGFVVVRAM